MATVILYRFGGGGDLGLATQLVAPLQAAFGLPVVVVEPPLPLPAGAYYEVSGQGEGQVFLPGCSSQTE